MTKAGKTRSRHRTEARSKVYAYEQIEHAKLESSELQQFKKNKTAWAFFNACPPSYQKVVLHWITDSKKPETRFTRLSKLIDAPAQ